jgi:hypothetical protein
MRKFLTRLDVSDALTFMGLALVGYGIYLISFPVALIVVGSILFLIGIFTAFPWKVNKK